MTRKWFTVLVSIPIAAMLLSACADPMPTAVPAATPTTILPASGQVLEIVSTQVSSKDGMTMLYVPAGDFLMGSREGEGLNNEHPQHTVFLEAYWIDQTEVTNAMFSAYVNDTGYQTDVEKAGKSSVFTGSQWEEISGADWQHPQGPSSGLSGLEKHPVVYVSWNDAQAYCAWAGRRLPTEAEWEKAARGTDGRLYPWGNESPSSNLANYGQNIRYTTEVGSYAEGASPFGALDMSGNVWEWVMDWYDSDYYKQNITNNPYGPANGDVRVLRGGSWFSFTNVIRTALRYRDNPSVALNDYGFRCAFLQ